MKTFVKVLGLILTITIVLSCEEKPVPPVISTTTITEISTTSVVSGGNITDDGGAPIISKGICWNTAADPTTENNKTVELGESLSFTSNISQLMPGTSYFVRAYAVNRVGISYGKSVSFKTLGDKPSSISQNASSIQTTTATLTGTVNPNSLETTISFEYGISASYGNSIAAHESPLSGGSEFNVTADLTDLIPGTTYNFRIKAENSLGITYSNDLIFTTLGRVPDCNTLFATNNTTSSVTLNGLVNPNYLPTTVIFEYGTNTDYGNSIAAIQGPISGSSNTNVTANLTGISELTAFHYRIKAENILGITTSKDTTFSTIGIVTDIDGNSYKAVLIGTQKWMAENLRTKHFSNGNPIFNGESVPNNCDSNPYYFNYNEDPNITAIYGLLYNYYAASNSNTATPQSSNSIPGSIQGACPTGWHTPSFPEIELLINYLGGHLIAGGKLKSTLLWDSPNIGATNSSSFNALPAGGYDKPNFNYSFLGQFTFIWSTSTSPGDTVYFKGIHLGTTFRNAPLNFVSHRCSGYSIRCLKN